MKLQIDNKKLLILILVFLIGIPIISHADVVVTLQWESNNPLIQGYQVFCREEGQSYDYGNFFWQGDHSFNQCTINGLDENKIYYFVVRAFTGDQVSEDSNEVRYPSIDNRASESSSGCMIRSLFN